MLEIYMYGNGHTFIRAEVRVWLSVVSEGATGAFLTALAAAAAAFLAAFSAAFSATTAAAAEAAISSHLCSSIGQRA
jgi:hypothetical protein